MTLVSTRGPVYFPAIDHASANAGNPTQETSILLDASAEKAAFIFRYPKSGVIDRARFRTGTVTTGDTAKISLQDVDLATGDPDGVVDQFRTLVIANGDDNASLVTGLLTSDGTDTGTKRTVTRGELGALVIEFNAFVAGSLNIATRNVVNPIGTSAGHYTDHFTAAWAKNVAALPRFALEYSDGSYAAIPYVCPAVGGIAGETYNSGTLSGAGGDERGMAFQVPFSCKVTGLWSWIDLDGDVDMVLYDSDGTSTLDSVSLDTNARVAGTPGVFHAYFDTEVTLLKDTTYRMSVKPTTVTSVIIYVGDYTAVAVLDALSGGQSCHYITRTDAGAWSPTTTKRPLMGLILSALDDGATTSSGSGGQGQLTPLAA